MARVKEKSNVRKVMIGGKLFAHDTALVTNIDTELHRLIGRFVLNRFAKVCEEFILTISLKTNTRDGSACRTTPRHY
ncbi:hypothetical protein DPMN_085462 [Dreissena polymorpha]|uniref:Uncharacterized protein n=1 Tax=Dreissena polymorpha TaxID=45954 RepID=A0A9D3YG83_DREPO|nr:hypothetical protein DPMN_085462 [Dreissena polymorpha]